MKFPKKTLQALVRDDYDKSKFQIVRDEVFDHSRWSVHHCMVFETEGKYYETQYSTAATEMQDEKPYEYAPDEIECLEVEPVEVVTVQYHRVKVV